MANMEIEGQKRGEDDTWEALAKRVRQGAQERAEGGEAKAEMDVDDIAGARSTSYWK
jgi:hypothetical protein